MMIQFRKTKETENLIIYDMGGISPGHVEINKQTHNIKILFNDNYSDKDEEDELQYVVKQYLIASDFPEFYTYAEG